MKRIVVVAALLACLSMAQAQERVPREECLKYALFLCGDLKQMLNTPIPTDPDVKRPFALRGKDRVMMALPEAKLSAEILAKAGKEVAPVGQIWMHQLTPMREGQAVMADKLLFVPVADKDKQTTLTLCALGVCKGADGKPELLIYGKEKEPLLRAPVKEISIEQDNPIEISAEGRDGGVLFTLQFCGKYEAGFMASLN